MQETRAKIAAEPDNEKTLDLAVAYFQLTEMWAKIDEFIEYGVKQHLDAMDAGTLAAPWDTRNDKEEDKTPAAKLYVHVGHGHYIGSTVIVTADDRATAEGLIRKELDDMGLPSEQLDVEEQDIAPNKVVYKDSGDY